MLHFGRYICTVTQMSKRRAKRRGGGCGQDLGELLRPGFFKALADAGRVGILCDLAKGGEPRTVGAIAACCTVDLSVVSRQLAMLREAGFVTAERRGKEVHYTACCSEVAELLRAMADAIDTCCPPAVAEKAARLGRKKGRRVTKAAVSKVVKRARKPKAKKARRKTGAR